MNYSNVDDKVYYAAFLEEFRKIAGQLVRTNENLEKLMSLSEKSSNLIRCFQCEYCETVNDNIADAMYYFCARHPHTHQVEAHDFCSKGERKR